MRWFIDFETRSELDVKKVGSYKYAAHPSTEVLCMGYLADKAGKEEKVEICLPNMLYLLDSEPELMAHNYEFEYGIWHQIMVPLGWPAVPIERWTCTAALAASYGLPRSLEGAAEALYLPVKKDKAGKALITQLSKPRPAWIKNRTGEKYFETPEKLNRLYEYCKTDVLVMREIYRKLNAQ